MAMERQDARFREFFSRGPGGHPSRPYQEKLALGEWPETLIIPTGLGKTAAVLAAWLWKVAAGDPATPRRLVYCLPMRVLVEQTAAAARDWADAASHQLGLSSRVTQMMGGDRTRRGLPDWVLHPEDPTILVGTQDLLVSAALMRGYGVSRYRWPVDFALLQNGSLWVLDEVQLAGATLTTSAQLEGLRRSLGTGLPSRTLWMSATLDPGWLTTPDFSPHDAPRPHDLSPADLRQAEPLWKSVKTLHPLALRLEAGKAEEEAYCRQLARQARAISRPESTTLLFVNRVARAQAVFRALRSSDTEADLLLVHSRFRGVERRLQMNRLLSAVPPAGRIVVTTQALEAGVDVTSRALITEIAPWSSLVQRIGRCNRYGECGAPGGDVYWADLADESASPYQAAELAESRARLQALPACGPEQLAALPLPSPPPGQILRRTDLLSLFDTEPDLSGFDVDVSPFVRDADDTDVRIFWRRVEGEAPDHSSKGPHVDETCPVPIAGARDILKRKGVRAWRRDTLEERWARVDAADCYPGCNLWLDAKSGGYDPHMGFDADLKIEVPLPAIQGDQTEEDMDNDPWADGRPVTLAQHTVDVVATCAEVLKALGLTEHLDLLQKVALWHDVGKAHPVFIARAGGAEPPLAKFPRNTQVKGEDRRYFRHELASALAFLGHQQWTREADLPAFLIAAHHGKVRLRIRALPKEKAAPNSRLFARGVWDGDLMPPVQLGPLALPQTALRLDIMQLGDSGCGASWAQRCQELLALLGPFRLALLEAVIRIADWRASATEDEVADDTPKETASAGH
ncbi:MAG TPA: CRISPR-associated helicase Cas3' [Terriglobales bacterium]|jgi:CRISPR-associated endonuclease/helicase Cas3